MADYEDSIDRLAKVIGNAKGQSSGYLDDVEHMTTDQQLKVAEISALLSISQEINHLRHYGDSKGNDRKGKIL